jgi:hypothetical protein
MIYPGFINSSKSDLKKLLIGKGSIKNNGENGQKHRPDPIGVDTGAG